MLIVGEKEYSELSASAPNQTSNAPPPYEPVATSSTSSDSWPTSANTLSVTLPDIRPTNLTRIRRTNNAIKGKFIIDPGLSVPDELLSPPEMDNVHNEEYPASEGSRKNLELQTTNGSVNAEIWLIDYEEDVSQVERWRRAELELRSTNGSATVKLRSHTDRPFQLNVSSRHGSASVSLPQNFIGPVILSTVYGSVTLSKPIEERLVLFSEESGTRKCFLGDYRDAGYTNKQKWTGSMAEISTVHGAIKLSFVDETMDNCSRNSGGFFRKWFASV